MKTHLYNILILLLSLFTFSCISDSPLDGTIIESDKSSPNIEEELYLNICIAASDTELTRTTGIDDSEENNTVGGSYDLGTVEESTVINGRVYVFEGEDETDAKCVTWGELENLNTQLETSGYLSVKSLKCHNIKLEKFEYDEDKKYFALVILNAKETGDSNSIYPKIDDYYNDNGNEKGWSTKAIENNMLLTKTENEVTKNYLTMTNATGMYSHSSMETFEPETLVTINHSDFSKVKKATTDNINTIIFVQRNVAKIAINNKIINNGGFNAKNVKIGDFNVQVSLAGWRIEVGNKITYPVMDIEDLPLEDKLFYTSSYLQLEDNEYFKRVFWSKDPNYKDKTSGNSIFANGSWKEIKDPDYCLENTMNYDCMLQGQSTRALFRCRWEFEYSDRNDKENYRQGYFPEDCNFLFNSQEYKKGIFYKIDNQDYFWCQHHLEEQVKKTLKNPDNLIVTFKVFKDNEGGYYSLKEFLSVKTGDNEISEKDYDKIAKAIGLSNADAKEMGVYENCRCYYVVRIPHFNGVHETPWDGLNEITKKADGTLIADYNKNHLGRYGVLRNVFYEITVNEIHHLGSPKIPEIIDDDTDDMPVEKMMSFDVKVLAWAKHDITVNW